MSDPGSTLTRGEVRHLAQLARIDLSEAELDHLAPQLAVILESIAAIGSIDTYHVAPTSHAVPLENVFRADEPGPSLSPEDALAAAPDVEQQRFKVPRILGEEA